MAKNWTIAEMVEAIEKEDASAIQDFTRRNPLTSSLLSRAISGDREALLGFFKNVPEYLNARKMETILKEDVEPYEEDDEKPAKKEKKAEKKSSKKEEKKPAKKEKKAKEVDGDIKSHPLYGLTKKSEFADVKGSELMSFKKMAGISGADWGKGKDDAIAAVIKWNKANAKGKAKPKKEEEEKKSSKKKSGKSKKADKKSTKKKSKPKKEDVDDEDDDDWDL